MRRSGSKADSSVERMLVKFVLSYMPCMAGLKSVGASWRVEVAGVLRDLGYVSTKADPNVWI